MAKLYDPKSLSSSLNSLEPDRATIDKILAFSKAYQVTKYKKITFDHFKN